MVRQYKANWMNVAKNRRGFKLVQERPCPVVHEDSWFMTMITSSDEYPIHQMSDFALNAGQHILANWFLLMFLFMREKFWYHLSNMFKFYYNILITFFCWCITSKTIHECLGAGKILSGRTDDVRVGTRGDGSSRESSSTDSVPTLPIQTHVFVTCSRLCTPPAIFDGLLKGFCQISPQIESLT